MWTKEARQQRYIEKLRDPRWQERRLRVFDRDEWTCRFCGNTEEELQVHHVQYRKGIEPWDVPDIDLVTLCRTCHAYETAHRAEAEAVLIAALRTVPVSSRHIAALAWTLSDAAEIPNVEGAQLEDLLEFVSDNPAFWSVICRIIQTGKIPAAQRQEMASV